MSEVSRDASIEGEAPVNPYSLLEAVNASSQSAYAAWLGFLGFYAYLLVAVAGVSHADLLVSADVSLPLLQVRLELTRFFLIVPALLLLAHVRLLAQLVVLARKSLELDAALRMVEATDRRSHPLRLELGNFFLVQALAGPERSRVVGILQHGLAWLAVAILPVLALLFVQATFLPYHDVAITSVHRWIVIADIAVLALIAAFFMCSEQTLRQALSRAWRQSPARSAAAVLAGGIGIVLAAFVMTIPGEPLDALARQIGGQSRDNGFALFGLVARNLSVPDTDLVVGNTEKGRRPTLNLRGRDLRFARLDRSTLSGADLTGANLDGASLVRADLTSAVLGCLGLDGSGATRKDTAADCTRGRSANFAKARLAGAMLAGSDLAGARFTGADLTGAVLTHADLAGADLMGARLDKADLGSTSLLGSNLSTASLSGADLSHARLTAADMTKAVMRAAVLNDASLEGVSLRNADLEAASFVRARLFGADLAEARIRAADLREAYVWHARVPEAGESVLADLAGINARMPSATEKDVIGRSLQRVSRARAADAASRLRIDAGGSSGNDPSDASWAVLARASEEATAQATTVVGSLVPTGGRLTGVEPGPLPVQAGGMAAQLRPGDRKMRLTRHLADLACQSRAADGAIATGLARRALEAGFNADAGALLESFRRPECAGGRNVPPAILERLAVMAEPGPR